MNRTIIFVDPSYNEKLGHYTRESSFIKKAASKACVDLIHFVSDKVSDDTSKKQNLKKRFSHCAYVHQLEDPIAAAVDFYDTVDSILAEMDDSEAERCCSLLMYTGHLIHLPMVADLINKHKKRFPTLTAHVCIFYLDNDFCMGLPSDEYIGFLKSISTLIETFDPDRRLKISADSDRTIRAYSPYFKRPLELLPFPIESTGVEVSPAVSQPRTKKIRILYVGVTIRRSGYELMYNTYKNLSCHADFSDEFELIVKHTPASELYELFELFVTETWNIKHVTEFLDDAALNQLYTDCDVILLPYSQKNYPCQTSGVFVEAVDKGKVVIVPENTWMADQVRKLGNGEIFESDNPLSFKQAILKVVRNLENYRPSSPDRTRDFLRFHSADTLLSKLIEKSIHSTFNEQADNIRHEPDAMSVILSVVPKSWHIKQKLNRVNKAVSRGEMDLIGDDLGCILDSDELPYATKCNLLVRIGYHYLEAEMFGDAQFNYEQALRFCDAGDSELVATLKAGICLCRGRECCINREYGRAQSFYLEALKHDSNHLDVNNDLGSLYFLQKRYKESAIHFLRTLARYPYNRPACLGAAEVMLAIGNKEYAVKLYKSFLNGYPEDKEVTRLLRNIQNT